MAAFSTRVWAMALVLAVTMSAFGIGEAEGTTPRLSILLLPNP